MPFSDLGLTEPILKAFKQKFAAPYPIQITAIPAILKGRDILGIAKTGSGKTLSYVLPVLQKLQGTAKAKNRHIKVLVLVPTRELAGQITQVFQEFSMNLPQRIKCMAVYGGVSINPQMIQLQGIEILTATPGRLLDLLDSNAVELSDVEMLVIDEADKILNLGFEVEVQKIFKLLNPSCQHLLFSATLNNDVKNIKGILLNDPIIIETEKDILNDHIALINQTAYLVSEVRKGPLLRYLIKTKNMRQVLVFASSIHSVDKVTHKLNLNGIKAIQIHSKLSQSARMEALRMFRSEGVTVLVATDLASRGIDIPYLPYVINYELPRSPKDYLHRIGRTGRAEASGEAISLISPDEENHFHVIVKKMGQLLEAITTDSIDLKGY